MLVDTNKNNDFKTALLKTLLSDKRVSLFEHEGEKYGFEYFDYGLRLRLSPPEKIESEYRIIEPQTMFKFWDIEDDKEDDDENDSNNESYDGP